MKYLLFMITLFASGSSHELFDFSKDANVESWRIVDDVVMGGESAGNFKINDDGHGEFYGRVSLENNGGFSSLRYRFEKKEIKDYSKVVLKVKGDGKDYQFRLKTKSSDYYSYITIFSTSGEWQEIEIDLKDLYPSFRGRKLDMPNFSSDSIEELTFLIANKKNEEFKLLLDSILLK